FAAQRRRTEEQRLLLLAARDFSAALSEEAVLQAIARHVGTALEAVKCTISQWEPAGDTLGTLLGLAPAGDRAADPRGTRYALADFTATHDVLVSRQPLAVDGDDPSADPSERRWLAQNGLARLLMVPLYSGEVTFGLLEIWRGV